MDFAFFESLSVDEANDFLKAFLRNGSQASHEFVQAANTEGICADFTTESIPLVLSWVTRSVRTLPKEADETLPWWIRSSDSYARSLFDFNEPSKTLLLRASFYFGESFVRNHRGLSWTIGKSDTVERNMPVVAGFKHRIQMAPMMIVENLVRRVVAHGGSHDDFQRAADGWVDVLP